MSVFIGIDFSGGPRPWQPVVRAPTVWLAVVRDTGNRPRLESLMPVQALPGRERPFDRLVAFIAKAEFEVATIDAPFALPLAHMPSDGHAGLLKLVRSLPNGENRPFPTGASLVHMGERFAKRGQLKPLRTTEAYWASKGVNTRSTMWAGPRGGAPFAAACLRLLERTDRPCWPWSVHGSGTLGEAFPAAQLCQWGARFQGYSRPDAAPVRQTIINTVRDRLDVDTPNAELMLQSTDALDSVLAAFGALAIAQGNVANYSTATAEGFIAVAQ
jgi:hypothetical protein